MNHPKINLNIQNSIKKTALHHAVLWNHDVIVAQLMSDDRIDSSLKNYDNQTPLKPAIYLRHYKCVNILREYGAPEE